MDLVVAGDKMSVEYTLCSPGGHFPKEFKKKNSKHKFIMNNSRFQVNDPLCNGIEGQWSKLSVEKSIHPVKKVPPFFCESKHYMYL